MKKHQFEWCQPCTTVISNVDSLRWALFDIPNGRVYGSGVLVFNYKSTSMISVHKVRKTGIRIQYQGMYRNKFLFKIWWIWFNVLSSNIDIWYRQFRYFACSASFYCVNWNWLSFDFSPTVFTQKSTIHIISLFTPRISNVTPLTFNRRIAFHLYIDAVAVQILSWHFRHNDSREKSDRWIWVL